MVVFRLIGFSKLPYISLAAYATQFYACVPLDVTRITKAVFAKAMLVSNGIQHYRCYLNHLKLFKVIKSGYDNLNFFVQKKWVPMFQCYQI